MFKPGDVLVSIDDDNDKNIYTFLNYGNYNESEDKRYDCLISSPYKNKNYTYAWQSNSLWYKDGRRVLIEIERQLHEV